MAATTSVRVSRETLRELEHLQKVFRARTADETIQTLVRERRKKVLERLQGSWKGLGPFTEADRLEAHD